MQETVDQLCSGISDDYSVLNIGFGLGIVSKNSFVIVSSSKV